ncbi:MAG TPA: cytochrome c, partial [Candidatus Paenibacillus intestinavium]|nr:cytochrome c [Candidatus Paenibacillus intestinavium]
VPAIIEADDPAMVIYESKCLGCHAVDLNGAMGPSLLGVGNSKSVEEIHTIIANGIEGTDMPSFQGTLSDDEIDQLATWLAKQTQE